MGCCLLGEQISEREKVLYRTGNFSVTPALGQMSIEGYLLICSNQHFPGVSGMPSELDEELERVLCRTKQVISENYCNPVVFEHGPRLNCSKGGGCLEHTHLHVVPTRANILGFLEKKGFVLNRIHGFGRTKEIINNGRFSYIVVEQDDERYVAEVDVLPSQYLRQVIAGLERRNNWNWRKFPDRETFELL